MKSLFKTPYTLTISPTEEILLTKELLHFIKESIIFYTNSTPNWVNNYSEISDLEDRILENSPSSISEEDEINLITEYTKELKEEIETLSTILQEKL